MLPRGKCQPAAFILKLMFRCEASLGDSRIMDCFSPAFFTTSFWWLWQTTFAFRTWSSAAEMRRYTVHVFWRYGLFPDQPGNCVKKTMSECTGEEIISELCQHLKIMDREGDYFASANCIPCMMPFIDRQFLPRKPGDRPWVVPDGAANFAFIGQFAEVPDDCVFTVEHSVRTAQSAVESLLALDKEVSPIYEGQHEIHVLVNALSAIRR